MEWTPAYVIRWLFDSTSGPSDRFVSRWIFLRALGAIYFSAFFSLVFQIRGLIGPQGILPANEYLKNVAEQVGHARYWYVPSLLWISSGSHMLMALCWVGMIAAVLLILNRWPRGMLVICFVCFLSFVSAAREFSGYQSDGMLLEAGFLSLFSRPAACVLGGGNRGPRCELRSTSCFGNGSASTLNPGWQKSPAAILNGATSPRWTTTIKTAPCPRGSAGTGINCRIGFTQARYS